MNQKIELTPVERLILANQYRILAKLYPSDTDEYEQSAEVLEHGYALEYSEIFQGIDSEVDAAICKEVLLILDLHRALHQGFEASTDQIEVSRSDIAFKGFDGNNETEQLSFANYFITRKDRYVELQTTEDFNSHWETLPRYRAMVREWQTLPTEKRFDLSIADIKRIISLPE